MSSSSSSSTSDSDHDSKRCKPKRTRRSSSRDTANSWQSQAKCRKKHDRGSDTYSPSSSGKNKSKKRRRRKSTSSESTPKRNTKKVNKSSSDTSSHDSNALHKRRTKALRHNCVKPLKALKIGEGRNKDTASDLPPQSAAVINVADSQQRAAICACLCTTSSATERSGQELFRGGIKTSSMSTAEKTVRSVEPNSVQTVMFRVAAEQEATTNEESTIGKKKRECEVQDNAVTNLLNCPKGLSSTGNTDGSSSAILKTDGEPQKETCGSEDRDGIERQDSQGGLAEASFADQDVHQLEGQPPPSLFQRLKEIIGDLLFHARIGFLWCILQQFFPPLHPGEK